MINLIWDNNFKKSYKKKISSSEILKNHFWNSIEIFVTNPFDKSLKIHKLSGRLKGLWAFSIDYNYRVIFDFIDNKNVLLIDIGTHEQVY